MALSDRCTKHMIVAQISIRAVALGSIERTIRCPGRLGFAAPRALGDVSPDLRKDVSEPKRDGDAGRDSVRVQPAALHLQRLAAVWSFSRVLE